jgi:hypothetical protein
MHPGRKDRASAFHSSTRKARAGDSVVHPKRAYIYFTASVKSLRNGHRVGDVKLLV